ncbi:MAG: ABC transporter permease [Candidatus Methanoperedens sp.]|nr:ABC transporter permease [Candidatus Methanoperedens sp.]
MGSAILKRLTTLLQRLTAIIIILLAWEIVVRAGILYPAPIPTASRVFGVLVEMALAGTLQKHTVISLGRVFSGYTLAVVIAIPLGLAVGWFKTFERYLDPLLQTLRQVPLLAWFPVFILIFGIGELSKILLIMLAAMWWILLSTISAVQNVDPFIVKTARSMGVSEWDMLRKVVLPSAVPSIFTGLRYAYTEVILVLFAVEMLGANDGLGSVMIYGSCHPGPELFMVYSISIFMAIIGLIANYMLVGLERRLCKWKEETGMG